MVAAQLWVKESWDKSYHPDQNMSSRSSASSDAFHSRAWCSESAIPVLVAGMNTLVVGGQCSPNGVDLPAHSSSSRGTEPATCSSSSTPGGAHSNSGSSCSTSSSSLPLMCRAWSLQLLLEAAALYGSMGAFAKLDQCFQLLTLAECSIATCSAADGPAELDAFVAARGRLLLQVLLLLSNGLGGQGTESAWLAKLLKSASKEHMPRFIAMMVLNSNDNSGGHASCC